MSRVLRLVVAATIASACLTAQVRPLHTRDLTRLSQVQIADVLKRNDIIFIPVGAVETNGILPSDRDYVVPLAYAMTMAETTNALYMPGLMWSYPGTTVIAPATIYLSPSLGTQYLKVLAKSLLRQGFRRQVWISSGQGPAPLTVGTMVREFFEETHVPILYIDMDLYLPRLQLPADARSKVLFGAHQITGRLEDLPLRGDYGEAAVRGEGEAPRNEGLATLGKLGFSGSLVLGSYVAGVMAHGGGIETLLPASGNERQAWGLEGAAQVRDIVKRMRLPEAMDALRKHDQFTQEQIVKKFSATLPGAGDHR